MQKLKPHLERFKPDLILNSWLYPEGYASMRCGRHLGVPVVHYCVGSDLRRIPDSITRYFTRTVIAQCHGVIAKSGDLARLAIAFGAPPANTRTVLNGFAKEVFSIGNRSSARTQLGLPLDRKIVLYAGNIVETKGVADLVNAVERFPADSEHIHTYLLGAGPYSAALQSLIDRLGLGRRITLAGPVPNAEMPLWMAACDVFCLPSHSEGCPNVIVEARACGRPVVATNVGGIPEITTPQSAILVPPGSPVELAKCLLEALNRDWNPIQIAAGLSPWDEVSKQSFQVCEEAMAGFRRPEIT